MIDRRQKKEEKKQSRAEQSFNQDDLALSISKVFTTNTQGRLNKISAITSKTTCEQNMSRII